MSVIRGVRKARVDCILYTDLTRSHTENWSGYDNRPVRSSGLLVVPGAHNPERATSMRSCRGVFTDQFIFRTVLAQILNIF